MKRIWYPLFLCIFLFSNCDSGSEDPVDDDPVQTTDDDVDQDETPPVITLSGLPDVLEVVTELTIEVSDESDELTTTVNLDGIEIVQSNQKTFVFDLNPFDYNLGDKTLEIKATDGSGNEASISEGFELKKLLFRYPATKWNHTIELYDNYLAVNKSNGDLVAFRKIENPDETVEFFADDEFNDDEIIVSQYLFSNQVNGFNINVIHSYPDIRIGTIFPTDAERENLQQLQYKPPLTDQSKSIYVEGGLFSNMRGYGGYIFKRRPDLTDDFEYSFNYASGVEDAHFIYDFSNSGEVMLDYKYLIIDDLNQSNFAISDFVQPTDFFEIAIPSGTFYALRLNGYKDESAYEQYKFHEVFVQTRRDSNGIPFEDVVLIPRIEEYSFYQKDLRVQMDSKTTLATVQKGLKPFEIHDLDVQIDGSEITIKGEYDIYNFGMDNGDSWARGPASGPFFSWSFYGKRGSSVAIPFSSFKIPEELLNKLEENAVIIDPTSNAIDNYFFSITDYEKETFSYEATLFGYGSIRNEYGDRFSLRKSLK